MKQNITIRQINELTDIGGNISRETWFKWLIDKKYLTAMQAHDAMSNLPYAVEHALESSNIGHMIEFLIHEVNFNLDYSDLDNTWGVRIDEIEIGDKELCDALWAAVKYKIKGFVQFESRTSKLGSIVEYDLKSNKKICTTCRKEIIKLEDHMDCIKD